MGFECSDSMSCPGSAAQKRGDPGTMSTKDNQASSAPMLSPIGAIHTLCLPATLMFLSRNPADAAQIMWVSSAEWPGGAGPLGCPVPPFAAYNCPVPPFAAYK